MRTLSLNRLCETALLVLLAVAILFKGGKTLETTWLLTGVAGICTLLQRFQVSGFRFQKERNASAGDRITPVVLLFILWTTLSYVFSKTQNYGLDEVLRDGSLGLLLLWYLNRGEEDNQKQLKPQAFEERFFLWLTRFAVMSCVIGIVVYVLQPVNRFVGTFLDYRFHTDYWPNAFAEFLLLTWPIVLLQSLINQKGEAPASEQGSVQGAAKKQKLLWWAMRLLPLSLVLSSLLLTYSRGAFIAFAGQLVLLFMLLFGNKHAGRDARTPLTILLFSLLVACVLALGINGLRSFFHPVQAFSEKITFAAEEGTSSISERREFWTQAALLSLRQPVFGWGPYSFRFVQPRLQTSVLATSDHPHNVFLKLNMERGFVASLLFAIIVFSSLFGGCRISFSGKRLQLMGDSTRLAAPLLTTAVAGTLAHNLIDYNLQFVGIALPFWMMMGMLLRNGGIKNREVRMKNTLGKSSLDSYFFILTSLFAVLLLLIALREGYYLVTSSLGRHAEAQHDETIALQWYERSKQEWFTRDMFLSEATLLLHNEQGEEAEEAVRTYLKKNAEDARAWKLLGTILASRSDFGAAIEAYHQAFAFGSWNDLSISRSLLEALFAETYQQPTSAAAGDSKRLSLDPRIAQLSPQVEKRVLAFTEAIERNHHFVALSPNPEEAVKILIMLSVLAPEKEAFYRSLREKIEKNTKRERANITARTPGWLW